MKKREKEEEVNENKQEKCSNSRMGQKVERIGSPLPLFSFPPSREGGREGAKKDVTGNFQKSELRGCIS